MNTQIDINNINSKNDFLEFMRKLIEDFNCNNSEWENKSIPNYLNAIKVWVSDMDGYYKNMGLSLPDAIPWKIFADVLYAAKMYE